jgi:hypothetical protein
MVTLGDDNLIVSSIKLSLKEISENSSLRYNMVSEASIDQDQGGFLRMIVYKRRDGVCESGPDIIRLRRRFEITNGVHEATGDNLHARNMSYCCMLGDLPSVREVCKTHNYELDLKLWYNWNCLIEALCVKYACNMYDVENEFKLLISMMTKLTLYTRSKLMFTQKGH